jgi:hypothetical protein
MAIVLTQSWKNECATTQLNDNSTTTGRPTLTRRKDNSTRRQLDQKTTRPKRQLDQKTTQPKRQLNQNQLDQKNHFEAEISHALFLASRVKYKPTTLSPVALSPVTLSTGHFVSHSVCPRALLLPLTLSPGRFVTRSCVPSTISDQS